METIKSVSLSLRASKQDQDWESHWVTWWIRKSSSMLYRGKHVKGMEMWLM
jgi:hypothetical protein